MAQPDDPPRHEGLIVLPAGAGDADAIAGLHVESWRASYAGMLPDDFLGGPIEQNRRDLWRARFTQPSRTPPIVLKALSDGELVGFACVLLDVEPAWGPCLDNLHVRPAAKGRGIGRRLFAEIRRAAAKSGDPRLHLWVFEANLSARRFYANLGGAPVEYRRLEVVPSVHVPEVRYVWP